jgi:hypothetical protein
MDLKKYYRKLRDIERALLDDYVIVRSLPTPDGGIAGRLTEVGKEVAARMVADGIAELAGADEIESFRRQLADQQRREEQKRASAQIQFTVLSEADLRALRKREKD